MSNHTPKLPETLPPLLSSFTTNRRYSLLEFLTIARGFRFFNRMQSLAGSTRKPIKADFGQLNVLSLELRFQIRHITSQLEQPTNLRDVPNCACLRESVKSICRHWVLGHHDQK